VAVKNGKDFYISKLQAELKKSVVCQCPNAGYSTFFIYIRPLDMSESMVLPPGNYSHSFQLTNGMHPALVVPPGMTLLLPSSQNVKSFFGEVWRKAFAERDAANEKRIAAASSVKAAAEAARKEQAAAQAHIVFQAYEDGGEEGLRQLPLRDIWAACKLLVNSKTKFDERLKPGGKTARRWIKELVEMFHT
jgi:hypothetical protein